MATRATDTKLSIHRFEVSCQLPAGLDPGAADQLAGIAREQLGKELQNALADPLSSRQGLLFIRRLELDMTIDMGLGAKAIAERWAAMLLQSLQRSVSQQSANVVYFPSKAAWMAQFIKDLVAGCAWQSWYYRALGGLRFLSASAVLRTLWLEQSHTITAALASLELRQRTEAISTLTAADAVQICAHLESNGGEKTASTLILEGDLLSNRDYLFTALSDRPHHIALYLHTELYNNGKFTALPLLIALARLLDKLFKLPDHKQGELFQAARSADYGLLKQHLSGADISQCLPLLQLDAAERRAILETWSNRSTPPRPTTTATEDKRYTLHGNVFLLLPLLQQWPLAEITRDWPSLEHTSPVAMLRWLILSGCQGGRLRSAALRDPLIRDLCGLPAATIARDIDEWFNTICIQQLGESYLQLLHFLVQQRHTGFQLLHTDTESPQPPRRFLLESASGKAIPLDFEGLTAETIAEHCGIDALRSSPPDTASGSSAQTLRQDFEFLAAPANGNLNPCALQLLTLCSQWVLKEFSYRLPGFANSSLPYLRSNFLRMSAAMQPETERWLVALERVPLSVILNMTGMLRQQYTLPEFDLRPLVLCQGTSL